MAEPKKQHRRARSGATPSRKGGALSLSESGLQTLATQINAILAGADAKALGSELTLDSYTRLAGALIRLAEAGVKCEKHRNDQQRIASVDGVEQQSLGEIESQLRLF